jgi:hypothetical protein
LSREIKDILDELHVMIDIKTIQRRVLRDFNRNVEHIIANPLAMSKTIGTAKSKRVTGGLTDGSTQERVTNMMSQTAEDHFQARLELNVKSTLQFASAVTAGLEDQSTDLKDLQKRAGRVETAVSSNIYASTYDRLLIISKLESLLSLKQQQASLLLARETIRQAEDAARQGPSITLFTIITVIFVSYQHSSSCLDLT